MKSVPPRVSWFGFKVYRRVAGDASFSFSFSSSTLMYLRNFSEFDSRCISASK